MTKAELEEQVRVQEALEELDEEFEFVDYTEDPNEALQLATKRADEEDESISVIWDGDISPQHYVVIPLKFRENYYNDIPAKYDRAVFG